MSLPKDPIEFARLFDHTILKPDATADDVIRVCEEAKEHSFYSVCVNSWHLPVVARELEDSGVIPCAVVGFPLGATATAVKEYEARWCVSYGAQELDMVINMGAYLGEQLDSVQQDIATVVKAAEEVPVKVIIETGYLTDGQIMTLSQLCAEQGAAFVKTSTGFGPRGASVEDVRRIYSALSGMETVSRPQIKASGGIHDLDSVLQLIDAGATRIGASRSVSIMKEFLAHQQVN